MTDAGFIAGLQVLYLNMQTGSSSPYIGCELHAKNGGQSTAPIDELKLRYYFTNDISLPPQIMFNWSHVSTPGSQVTLTVTSAVAGISPVVGNADSYLEFSLSSPGHPNLAPNESADFSWQMQGPNPAQNKYTQSNDYSWDMSKTSLQPWDHVVLLRNGTVVWGTPPG
jgi:mannan endo-1,4-beta-mannosidase